MTRIGIGLATCLALLTILAALGVGGPRALHAWAAARQEIGSPGVLGQPRAAWDEAYGDSEAEADGYMTYKTPDGSGIIYIRYDETSDVTTYFEWTDPIGDTFPFADMEDYARTLLPGDADFIDEFQDATVAGDDGRVTVQLYLSDDLTDMFPSSSGYIMVAYGRDGTGPNVRSVSLSVGSE